MVAAYSYMFPQRGATLGMERVDGPALRVSRFQVALIPTFFLLQAEGPVQSHTRADFGVGNPLDKTRQIRSPERTQPYALPRYHDFRLCRHSAWLAYGRAVFSTKAPARFAARGHFTCFAIEVATDPLDCKHEYKTR